MQKFSPSGIIPFQHSNLNSCRADFQPVKSFFGRQIIVNAQSQSALFVKVGIKNFTVKFVGKNSIGGGIVVNENRNILERHADKTVGRRTFVVPTLSSKAKVNRQREFLIGGVEIDSLNAAVVQIISLDEFGGSHA